MIRLLSIPVKTALAAVLALGFTKLANAEFPEKPITIIEPWPAGDAPDTGVRVLGEMAKNNLGQPVVVNNVVGAGGTKATLAGATAEPDGYTLLNNWVAPQIAAKLFNPDLDYSNESFIPIAGHMAIPFTVTVASSHPANTAREFVEWAKTQDKPLNYGVCAAQSVSRLVGEQFMRSAGVENVNPIPNPGGCMGENMKGLLNGSLDVAVGVLPATRVFGGQVKHLSLISDERSTQAPDLPSAAEQGITIGWGNAALGWGGLVVPAGTPEDRVQKLREVFAKWINDEQYLKRMNESGVSIQYVAPEEFGKLWDSSTKLLAPHIERLKSN